MVVERVDHKAERHVALVLRRASREHEEVRLRGSLSRLSDQGALADAGLAQHADGVRLTRPHAGQRRAQRLELGIPLQQLHRRQA